MRRKNPTGYWWIGRPNFGDLLTPLLFSHFCNVQLDWAPISDAQVIGIGSILEHLPNFYSGMIVGSGKLREDTQLTLDHAHVYGVRGPLTAKGLHGNFVLGDPGLLADELVEVDKEYALGLVPHWSDEFLEKRPEFQHYKPLVIRPTGDPLTIIRQIGSCHKIVSSSLHGIVLADAFGIPRRIEMTRIFAREGGDFKFRDHNAAIGVPHQIGRTQEAPRYRVQDRQQELWDMLRAVGYQLLGEDR